MEKVAALARTILFRRIPAVLIRPHAKGLIANTLIRAHFRCESLAEPAEIFQNPVSTVAERDAPTGR